MADGSVTIGVALDTAAFASSIAAVEGQLSGLGARLNQSMAAAFSGTAVNSSFTSILSDISNSILQTASLIEQTLSSVAASSIAAFSGAGWSGAGSSAAGAIAVGITSGGGTVTSAARAVSASAASAFDSGSWSSIGSNMMSGVASGIRAAGSEVIAAINQISKETESAVKSYYSISSPSALMRDEVGVMISRGIAEGILSGAGFVNTALDSVWRGSELPSKTIGAAGIGTGSGSVTQNIYLRDSDSSPYKTARRIKQESETIFRN